MNFPHKFFSVCHHKLCKFSKLIIYHEVHVTLKIILGVELEYVIRLENNINSSLHHYN